MRSAIFLIFSVVLHPGYLQTTSKQDNEEANVEACIKETKVDPALIDKFYDEGKFLEDKNLKCFLKCMFVKDGDMTESGQILVDAMKAHPDPGITPAQAGQIVDACKSSTGTDPCDIAFQLEKCLVQEVVKMFGDN